MTVFRNAGQWDASNVVFRDGRVIRYEKGGTDPALTYIDYGLTLMSANAIASRACGERFDLGELYTELIARDELAGYEVFERFYEIGSPAGLAETEAFLRGSGSPATG